MICDSELLTMTADEIVYGVRYRQQVLAEQAPRLTRVEVRDTLAEIEQLRERYVFLRGAAALAADLAR